MTKWGVLRCSFCLLLTLAFQNVESKVYEWGKFNSMVVAGEEPEHFREGTIFSRRKRAVTAFTTQEQLDLTEKHNALRRQEGGADIEVMVGLNDWCNDAVAVAAVGLHSAFRISYPQSILPVETSTDIACMRVHSVLSV